MENSGAIATVETMQNVVGSPIVALSQSQKLDYIENVDQSKILQGILGGIMQMYSVLLDIKNSQNIQTTEAIEANKIQQEEQRQIRDVSSEQNLEATDDKPMMEKLGNITGMLSRKIKGFGEGAAKFGKSIGGFFAARSPLFYLVGALFLLKTQIGTLVNALTPAIEAIRDKIIPPLVNLYEKIIKPFITTFIEGLGKGLPSVFEGLGSIIQGIVDIFSGDIIKGLKNIFGGFGNILKGAADFILNFFSKIVEGIKAPFITVYDFIKPGGTADKFLQDSVYAPIDRFFKGVKQFFVNLWDGAVNAVQNTFKSIGDFFSNIVDKIKTAINGAIDALPLPGFIKDKLKLETNASREADERITETGIKAKYVDRSDTGMEKKRYTKGALMKEGYEEATQEGYRDVAVGPVGAQVRGILTGKELNEFMKLDDEQQMDYLRNYDEKEYKRRMMIMDLYNKEYSHRAKLARMIEEGKALKPEFDGEIISPDDKMNKFMTPKQQRNIPSLERDAGRGGTSVVNSPVNSSTVVNNSQPTINYTKMDTGVDSYTEKLQYSA